MNEEKKEYSIIGQVTIGTDEYRDLIESLAEVRANVQREHETSWNRYLEIDKLNRKIKELETYKEYVTDKCMDSYRMWKIEKEEVKE